MATCKIQKGHKPSDQLALSQCTCVISKAYCQLSCSFSTGQASQSTFALVKTCSHTVFPAPLGPTSTVRGLKKEMTCLSLSSIPKLLTPRMLILSIFDIFTFWETATETEKERTHGLNQQQCWKQDRMCQSTSLWDQLKKISNIRQIVTSNSQCHLKIQLQLHRRIGLSWLALESVDLLNVTFEFKVAVSLHFAATKWGILAKCAKSIALQKS